MASVTFKLDIDSATPIPEDNLDRMALIRALGIMHAAVPLVRFRMKSAASSPPGFLSFTYHFERVDGKEWDQNISFHDPPTGMQPLMTFSVGNFNGGDLGWHIDEFALQRPIRDLVIKMFPAFGITDLHARWV